MHRSIIDVVVEGIWIVDQDGRLDFANPAIARMLGYEPEEMYGQQATDFFLEDDREQASQEPAHGKQKWSNLVEIRLWQRDGSVVWTSLLASPVHGDDGSFLGVLGILDEVSAKKKKVEVALRETAETLKAIQETCPLAIVGLDKDLRVLL
jgi:PAS domain S-box-containing protein